MGTRKNQASLTAPEIAAFVAAVKALKANGSYDVFVAQHRAAFMAGVNDPAHSGPAFLPWHREYLRRFELALQAIDPSVTIPYWDWTVDRLPTASLWSASFMGGNGRSGDGRVMTGPFAFSTGQWNLTVRDPGDPDLFLTRAFGSMGALPTQQAVDDANELLPYDAAPWNGRTPTSASFRSALERVIHNPGHMWVGGSMMAMSSPNDPVFWLHHCNIDRLWAVWQRTHPAEPYVPTSGTPGVVAGHALDDPMPPWAAEPTPPTPRAMLDYHALGYSYDDDPIINAPHWHHADLTATTGASNAASEPAGYMFDSQGTQHVVYRDSDDHIRELWWDLTGWHQNDLSARTGAPIAVGDPAGYMFDAQGTQHVVFRAGDGHIHEFWWGAGGWRHHDLTLATGAPNAAGDPAGYMFDAQGTQHIVYRGADAHIHELWWAQNGWHHNDLTIVAEAPNAAGDPSGYMFNAQGTQHVVYRGADGHIHELWWGQDGWQHSDLTSVAAAPNAAGDPAGYMFDAQGTQHVVYRGADGHIHELWWGTGGWQHSDLTVVAAAPDAAGDPAGYMFDAQGTQHVVYRGGDSHIHELSWGQDGWQHGDLTANAGAPSAASDPAGYSFDAQGTQHVVYRGGDGHIHELWWG